MRLRPSQFRLRPDAGIEQWVGKQLKSQLAAKKQSEQGMTLMEVIVAIVIITVVIAAATPPIFISVAVRVQNRKAEQAIQIGQQEIERVRRIMQQGNNPTNIGLPPVASATPITSFAGPSTICVNPCTTLTASKALRVGDFLVQTFRNAGATLPSTEVVAFRMGVRVYSKAAQENLGSLQTTPASLQFTTGQGKQPQFPLAVFYTELAQPDKPGSLNGYKTLLGN